MAPVGTKEQESKATRGSLQLPMSPSAESSEAAEFADFSGRPAGRLARLPWKKTLLLLLVVVLLVGCASVYTLVSRAAPIGNVQLFTVTRRSFPVLLKERGELKANSTIDIRSELEGRATIIYLIPEGSRVEEGELLVELASDEIDNNIRDAEAKEATALAAWEAAVKTREIQRDENASKIRKAQLALELAELAQNKYIEGEKKELEQDASLAVEKAEMVRDREEQDYKDAQELFGQGFITRVELKDAEFNSYAAKLDLAKAKLALEVLNKYTIPMSLREKESAVHEAKKELEREEKSAAAAEAKATADVDGKKSELDIIREKLAKLRDQKKKSRILAPASGLVVYAREHSWRTETSIETGVEVHERQMLIQLPDTSQMKVECRVHEAQIERLKVGMPALVEVEGFPGQTFRGKVSRIAVMADSQNYWLNPNLREYKTDILLEGTYTELKPNVTARAEIQMAQLENVLAVPIQAVFGKAGRFFVFVDENGLARPAPVTTGLSSTEFVEITAGLTEGQAVRLAITDEMKLLLPEDLDTGDTDEGEDGSPRRRARREIRETAVHPASRAAEDQVSGSRQEQRTREARSAEPDANSPGAAQHSAQEPPSGSRRGGGPGANPGHGGAATRQE